MFLAIIEISIRDKIILGITTPNEDTWQTFKELFEQHIDVWWLLLNSKQTNLCLEEGGLVVDFLK
jgi:hypothetical protein